MRSLRTIIIVILVMVVAAGMALAQPPRDLPAKKQQANADLDIMAKELAKLAAQPGFLGFLRSEIVKSKNRENIIDLDKFLQRGAKMPGMPPGLEKYKNFAQGAGANLMRSSLQKFEGYDVYIPVSAHRKKWQGGKNFLVAFTPVEDEKNIKQIVAYSVSDGSRVMLDPKKAPETVVLTIAPCEHGNVGHAPPPPGIIHETPQPEKPEPGKPKGSSWIGVPYVKLLTDLEGWLMGDPEVYVFIGQVRITSPYRHKHYLGWVNDVGRLYWLGDRGLLYKWWDGNYKPITGYIWMEEDWGLWKSSVGLTIFGVGMSFTVSNGDDHFGTVYVDRNAVPWGGYQMYSTGRLQFWVDKDY